MAAEDLDEVLGDGQPQAEPARLAGPGPVHLVEPLEDPAPVLWGDAWAPVADADDNLVPELGDDVDGGAGGRELSRIVEQVAHGLGQLGPVRRDLDIGGPFYAHLPVAAEPGEAVVYELAEVEGGHLYGHCAGLDVAELAEVVDDLAHQV